MATNLGNRVTYRSPDALQNLRLKVTLTRISGPRMDRAREMDARFGSGPTPQAQIQAAQQQAQQATSLAAPAPLDREPPPPSTPPPPPPAAPTQSQSFGGDALAGEGDDATTHRGPSNPPPASSRRNRSVTQQQAAAALPGQGIPARAQAPAAPQFDPYGSNAGPGGPVTESYSPGSNGSSDSPPGLRRVEAWTDDDDASPTPKFQESSEKVSKGTDGGRAGPVVEGAGGADSLRDQAGSFQAQRADTGEVRTYTREIAWQEKIFSVVDVDRLSRREPETELERKYAAMIHERGATNAGEIIYTYVSADSFADERDAERTVTTSAGERWNGLFRAVFGTPSQRVLAKNASGRDATRLRTELAHGRRRRAGTEPSTFVICADCGPLSLPAAHPAFKNAPSGAEAEREQVLMTIEAYSDGSIALTPDFSQSVDDTRRIERRDGSVWEYSVVNASERRETPLEQRTKDIAPAAALRRLQLTRKAAGAFVAPPGEKPGSVRFLALAEIVAGRGFDRDFLYCEWVLDYDKDLWRIEGESAQTSGVTQISRCVEYPATGDGEGDAWGSGDRMAAHWSLPVELSCVADSVPPPAKHPVVYFQVSSYDEWDRYRCEGYGHLNLGALPVGSCTKVIKTWKAGGTIADRVASQFVGGSPEIGDVSYAGVPADAKDKPVHSRLGFVADSSGEIKVRVNIVTQTKADASAAAKKGLGLLKGLLGKGGPGAKGGDKEGAPGKYEKKEAVEDVVSRARARLAEARAQNRQNPAAAPRAMLLSRREAEARPAPAQPAPYAYAGTAAPAADALARARARVSGGSAPDGSAPVPVPAVPVPETPAPNMASPPAAPAVESIDDDGAVSSLAPSFDAAAENVAPGTTVVGTESKSASVVGAASAP